MNDINVQNQDTSTEVNNFIAMQEDKELLLSKNLGYGNNLSEMMVKMGSIVKIPTNIDELDKVLGGGIRPGITILGAITTAGKTTLAQLIAENISVNGTQVVYYSNDMSTEYLTAKNLSRCSYKLFGDRGFDSSTVLEMLSNPDANANGGKMGEVMKEYAKIAANIQYIDCFTNSVLPPLLTEMGIIKFNIKLYAAHGIKTVFVVDYLQNIPSSDYSDTKTRIEASIKILQTLAITYKIPIIVISSISRAFYRQELSLDSFKESGNIEYAAETIIGLQYKRVTEDGFNLKTEMKKTIREMELVILKNKLGVSGEKVEINFIPKFNSFCNDSHKKKTSKDFAVT